MQAARRGCLTGAGHICFLVEGLGRCIGPVGLPFAAERVPPAAARLVTQSLRSGGIPALFWVS